MGDKMEFPDTVEEFMEQYKIVDTDHVYTNGVDLVPIFRMVQWFNEHQGCEFCDNGICTQESSDSELHKDINKLKEENRLLSSENQTLRNMIIRMCYEKYGQ